MSQQYIFTIEALTRIYEQKEVLSNIWLSFYPGAKIGVIGDNGAGKSTLLRDHGRRRQRLHGDGPARPRASRIGYFPAGAAAREVEHGRRVHSRCRRRIAGHPRPLQRNQHEAGRGPVAGGDGKAARRTGPRAGQDRRRQSLGTRPHARDRHGRHAAAAGRREDRAPLRRRKTARRPLPDPAAKSRPACCSTNRPTISTPNRSPGSNDLCTNSPGPSSPSRTTATSSTTSPAGSSKSTAAAAIPYEGNYSGWLEQKQARLADRREAGIEAAKGC